MCGLGKFIRVIGIIHKQLGDDLQFVEINQSQPLRRRNVAQPHRTLHFFGGQQVTV